MCLFSVLLLTASLTAGPASLGLQEAPQAAGTEEAERQRAAAIAIDEAEYEAFSEVLKRYNNDIGSHHFDCRQLRRDGVAQSEWPPSPLFKYFDIFIELAEAGNGRAQHWIVGNSASAIEDPLERRKLIERMYTRLAEEHASSHYLIGAMDDLLRARQLLGREFVRKTLRTIGERSRIAEIEAKALWTEAALIFSNGKTKDPTDVAQAVELWQILVDGYPATESAGHAAQRLFTRTNRAMQKNQRAWIKTVRDLRDKGIGEEGWPTYPLESFRAQFATLASAEHLAAAFRTEVFFPAYDQALRRGITEALRFISTDTSERFLVQEWPWMDVKFEILEFLFETYPQEPWVYEEVEGLLAQAQRVDRKRYVPLLETVIARTRDRRTADQARFVLAKNLETGSTFEELQRAMALYTEIVENSSIERQRKEAEVARDAFSWVMPGALMPTFEARDGEGLDIDSTKYRGRILMLYFWGFWSPESMEDIPRVNALHAKYSEQPLSILGFNTDTVSYKSYAGRSGKVGITWRCSLETKRKGPRLQLLGVFNFPTTIIVDAEGVIRGRNLDNQASEALIDSLLAELASPSAPAAQESGLYGRVSFDGSRDPLPPLRVTDGTLEQCLSEGHELDLTDRRRLVDAEGGLANVVVSVDIPGITVSGRGVEVLVEQADCRFEPHVAIAAIGSSLLIKNSDPVPHHLRLASRRNGSMNVLLAPATVRRIQCRRADRIVLGCDMRPWMSSTVHVTKTPFCALTDKAGCFEIPNLPPGEYRIKYWHAELGSGQTELVRVEEARATEFDFSIGDSE